eukprot:4649325-Amphidinium_carterae.2
MTVRRPNGKQQHAMGRRNGIFGHAPPHFEAPGQLMHGSSENTRRYMIAPMLTAALARQSNPPWHHGTCSGVAIAKRSVGAGIFPASTHQM